MSWSRRAIALKILAILALVSLASCSGFRPVYGDVDTSPAGYAFSYADPASRLDQIIYTELRLRLGPETDAPDAIRVVVTSYSGARGLTRTAVVKPGTSYEMDVTASVLATAADGTVLFSGTRRASAIYQTRGQVLADTEAQTEAAERAAKALADSVRLAIIGALPGRS